MTFRPILLLVAALQTPDPWNIVVACIALSLFSAANSPDGAPK